MKDTSRWYTERIQDWVRLVRSGHWGAPVLLFSTAGGDGEQVERMGLVGALWPLIEAGRIKVYSLDSIAGRAWLQKLDPRHCSWLQNQFDAMIAHEVVPAIRTDCRSPDVEIITAGMTGRIQKSWTIWKRRMSTIKPLPHIRKNCRKPFSRR
jgi:esterase/lipase superfamily enzyme